MIREITCTICPVGCNLKVTLGAEISVSGNLCPRGEKYGKEEVTNPVRTLTSTVRINNGLHGRLPVKTSKPIPKEIMYQCMKVLENIYVSSPINLGDIVVKDILGTGADIVATRTL